MFIVSQVTLLIFGFSSHNFGEVAVIDKFQYFQNYREFGMGRPCWMFLSISGVKKVVSAI